jgi:hypothetical protein
MNLVREHINEKFIDSESDPIHDMHIGTYDMIKKWLDKMDIKNYIINNDLTIDVDGQVNLLGRRLTKIPSFIQFNKVRSYFSIARNQLISLRGCPYYVGNNFYCDFNELKSLKYMPKYIGNYLFCNNNLKNFTFEEISKYCDINVARVLSRI